MEVGYASGAFDMLHIGHVNLLRRARLLCDFLLVGVVTDATYVEMRGRPPIVPFEERLAIVRHLRFVDAAIGDDHVDKREAWELHRFDFIIKGDDWRVNPMAGEVIGRLAEVGVGVRFLPYTMHTSSSRLRALLDKFDTGTTTC